MSGEGHDAELEKLQEQIHKGTEETKTYLASVRGRGGWFPLVGRGLSSYSCRGCYFLYGERQLKERLAEYDEHFKVSETATSFLQAGMDRAHKSVDEVRVCRLRRPYS